MSTGGVAMVYIDRHGVPYVKDWREDEEEEESES
jgi:hypothetical protein